MARPHPVHSRVGHGARLMSSSDEVEGLNRHALIGALGAAVAFAPAAALAADAASSVPALEATSTLLAFADQAGNLAGPLFASSLFPYLVFLYFLRQDANGLSPVAKGGFTFLLAFVTATVVTSIVGKSTFALNLANIDWLHGGAEQLLAFTNIINVIGLKLTLDGFESGKVTQPAEPSQLDETGLGEGAVIGTAAAVAALACGVTYLASGGDLAAHSAYLGGLGNLPEGLLPISEPDNALSLPTWVIHASSLLEWLVAMGLVWRIGLVSGNPRWKGMTWAMIPSHSSGVCACVYHIFYNQQQWVVLSQSALTLLGNCCLAFASYRLASSNGWTFSLPFGQVEGSDETAEEVVEEAAEEEDLNPLEKVLQMVSNFGKEEVEAEEPETVFRGAAAIEDSVPLNEDLDIRGGLGIVLLWSLISSYVVKYGGAAVPITSEAPDWLAFLLIAGVTGFNVFKWNERSRVGGDFGGLI